MYSPERFNPMNKIKPRDAFGRLLRPGHQVRAKVAGKLRLALLTALQPAIPGQPLLVTVLAMEGPRVPVTLPARRVTRL